MPRLTLVWLFGTIRSFAFHFHTNPEYHESTLGVDEAKRQTKNGAAKLFKALSSNLAIPADSIAHSDDDIEPDLWTYGLFPHGDAEIERDEGLELAKNTSIKSEPPPENTTIKNHSIEPCPGVFDSGDSVIHFFEGEIEPMLGQDGKPTRNEVPELFRNDPSNLASPVDIAHSDADIEPDVRPQSFPKNTPIKNAPLPDNTSIKNPLFPDSTPIANQSLKQRRIPQTPPDNVSRNDQESGPGGGAGTILGGKRVDESDAKPAPKPNEGKVLFVTSPFDRLNWYKDIDDNAEENEEQPFYLEEAGHQSSGNHVENSGDCPKCDFTIDLRCTYTKNHGPFHRIKDCLIPSYGLIEKARKAIGQKCAILWTDRRHPNLRSVLLQLARDVNFKFLADNSECIQRTSLRYGTVAEFKYRGFHYDKNQVRSLDHVQQFFPVNIPTNLGLLHKDVVSIAGPKKNDGIIIIQRSTTLKFDEKTAKVLNSQLNSIKPSVKVSNYRRGEALLKTIDLFMNAGVVLGYFGAGFVNIVYKNGPICAIEISHYKDFNNTGPWQTNAFLTEIFPNLKWHLFAFPLKQLLHSNNVSLKTQEDLPQPSEPFIKEMKHVILSNTDVGALKAKVSSCFTDGIKVTADHHDKFHFETAKALHDKHKTGTTPVVPLHSGYENAPQTEDLFGHQIVPQKEDLPSQKKAPHKKDLMGIHKIPHRKDLFGDAMNGELKMEHTNRTSSASPPRDHDRDSQDTAGVFIFPAPVKVRRSGPRNANGRPRRSRKKHDKSFASAARP